MPRWGSGQYLDRPSWRRSAVKGVVREEVLSVTLHDSDLQVLLLLLAFAIWWSDWSSRVGHISSGLIVFTMPCAESSALRPHNLRIHTEKMQNAADTPVIPDRTS
jgi:hypothetical protein